jgi:hypothetical protein
MTTVYNSTVNKYVYFNAIKQPGASLKYLILSSAMHTTESAKSTLFTQAIESIKAEATKTGYN